MKYSIIVPVYNRPNEVNELLKSLAAQTEQNFEVVLVEDGSTLPCQTICEAYKDQLEVHYFAKPNSGRSLTRNYGMERAQGDYFLFFDSDVIIPADYIQKVNHYLEDTQADCFGGPDKAHHSFSILQKAISYSMTSFFTTGGIRGSKKSLEKFVPRTFNMGFSRKVYAKVGGFKDMFGEDIDLSTRISEASFSVKLFPTAFVYHKRRVSLSAFYHQVYVFGMARVDLYQLHPESLKIVHLLPAAFVLGTLFLMLLACFVTPYALWPLAFYVLALFFESLFLFHNPLVSFLAIATSTLQLSGYGLGFLSAFCRKIIFKQSINIDEALKKHYKKKA